MKKNKLNFLNSKIFIADPENIIILRHSHVKIPNKPQADIERAFLVSKMEYA